MNFDIRPYMRKKNLTKIAGSIPDDIIPQETKNYKTESSQNHRKEALKSKTSS